MTTKFERHLQELVDRTGESVFCVNDDVEVARATWLNPEPTIAMHIGEDGKGVWFVESALRD